ncbi:FCD domain-containing protein [Streptomyces sp. NBC_00075]|uniref:FadR/GntR family transcriptional regulator n=1 Tax=Streptomyces sp. NBC_00075 TaxID=2975641 RepID=UPI0032477B07
MRHVAVESERMTEDVGRAVERPEALPRLPKISEQLADRLRATILGRGMRPGDRLSSEAELISHYGVARGTVREALRLLESEGIIEIRRGRQGGIMVRKPEPDRIGQAVVVLLTMAEVTVRELIDYRLLIEPGAAGAAARTATDKQCAALRRLATEEPHQELEFHVALAECSDNSLLRLTITTLHKALTAHSYLDRITPADEEAARRAHHAILQAVEQRDPEMAGLTMTRHLQRFRELLAEHDRLNDRLIPSDWWLSRI